MILKFSIFKILLKTNRFSNILSSQFLRSIWIYFGDVFLLRLFKLQKITRKIIQSLRGKLFLIDFCVDLLMSCRNLSDGSLDSGVMWFNFFACIHMLNLSYFQLQCFLIVQNVWVILQFILISSNFLLAFNPLVIGFFVFLFLEIVNCDLLYAFWICKFGHS